MWNTHSIVSYAAFPSSLIEKKKHVVFNRSTSPPFFPRGKQNPFSQFQANITGKNKKIKRKVKGRREKKTREVEAEQLLSK